MLVGFLNVNCIISNKKLYKAYILIAKFLLAGIKKKAE